MAASPASSVLNTDTSVPGQKGLISFPVIQAMRWWRRNIDSSDVLNLGTTTLAIVRDVADVASCAPLRGIAALLLTILENVKAG